MFTVFAVSSSSSADDNSGEASATTSKTDTASKSGKTEESKEDKTEVTYTINNEVIVDNDQCSFVIKEAVNDSFWGTELKVACENKTADRNLMFAIYDVSINGYMVNTAFAKDIAANKKANDDITFVSSLRDIGITSIDEMTFNLKIYDSDHLLDEAVVDQTFTIYPTGKEKSDIVVPERKKVDGEKILVDNEYCTYIILEDKTESIWGYKIKCYVENKTDKKIMASWNDVSVNGYMVTAICSESVTAGNRSYCEVTFLSSDFEENEIENVEKVEFKLSVYKYLDIISDKYVEQVFTYEP